jgi:hypothetical protein
MTRGEGLPVAAGWIAVGVVAVGIGAGVFYGLPLGVLCLAGGVLVGVVLLIWGSVQSLTGTTSLSLEEAVSLGAPSAEEERKQSVLRALKDLEYERGVGKISEADYQELSARYRAEAKALLKALDHDLEPFRKRVLDEVERRVESVSAPSKRAKRKGSATAEASAPEAEEPAAASEPREPEASAAPTPAPAPTDTRVACPACGARNEADAKFCKGCGGKLGEEIAS